MMNTGFEPGTLRFSEPPKKPGRLQLPEVALADTMSHVIEVLSWIVPGQLIDTEGAGAAVVWVVVGAAVVGAAVVGAAVVGAAVVGAAVVAGGAVVGAACVVLVDSTS